MQILLLHLMGLQLLLAIQTTPNLTAEFRAQAEAVANLAINYQGEEITPPTPATTTPVIIPQVTPSFIPPEPPPSSMPPIGGIITPPMPQDLSEIKVELNRYIKPIEGRPEAEGEFGTWAYFVYVIDPEGRFISDTEINLTANDNARVARGDLVRKPEIALSREDFAQNKLRASFEYRPTSKGLKTLTFTANGMSKSIEIEVK